MTFQQPNLVRLLLGTLVDCLYLLWCGSVRQCVLNQWARVACIECWDCGWCEGGGEEGEEVLGGLGLGEE